MYLNPQEYTDNEQSLSLSHSSQIMKETIQSLQSLENENMDMKVICLMEGDIELNPLFVINPAGASALTYHDFCEAMHKNENERPIYGIDDGYIVDSNAIFPYLSIEDVVFKCATIVKILMKHTIHQRKILHVEEGKDDHNNNDNNNNEINKTEKILLAGWSYGGVVSAALAQYLSSQSSQLQMKVEMNIEVQSLVLFDAPLRETVHFNKEDEENLEHQKMLANNSTNSNNNDDNNNNGQSRALEHYKLCTKLLSQYHQRPLLQNNQKMLTCPVLDMRPIHIDVHKAHLQEITHGDIIMKQAKGSHFTMLLNENQNAKHAADIVMQFIEPINKKE
jgi:thioesterase domain-containing protein